MIVYAHLQGGFVLTTACSKERPRYDINHGLTNWAVGVFSPHSLARNFPAYTTGLISARRALTKLGLGDKHDGVTAPDHIFAPHADKRFPVYDAESKERDTEMLKKYIYGGHVAAYMERQEMCFMVHLLYVQLICLLPHLSP